MTAAPERDYWAVVLDGDDGTLANWEKLLDPGFDPIIQRLPDTGEIALRSEEFEEFSSAKDVHGFAVNLINDINGSVKSICNTGRVEVGSICEIRKNGSTQQYVFLVGQMVEVGDIAAIITVSTGGKPPIPQPSMVQKWVKLALQDDIVSDMLKHIGDETSWYNLYKAYEGVRALSNRTGGLHNKPWAPESMQSNFRHTANRMRHGRSHPAWKNAPPHPMPISEAQRFIQSMVYGIMGELVP